jgi:hypothetical protein
MAEHLFFLFWPRQSKWFFSVHFIYRIVYREEEEDKRRRGFAMMRFSNVMSTRVGGCRTARRFRLMNSRIISDIWPSFLSSPFLYIHALAMISFPSPLLLFPPASDRLAVSLGRCTQKNAMARSSKGFFFYHQ